MIIKLSELKNDDVLLVDGLVMSKECYIREKQEHIGKVVYTTTKYRASIDVRDMLENVIECETNNMYEDWEDIVWNDIAEQDIKEIQNVLDRILSGSNNISYIADKKVEVDI